MSATPEARPGWGSHVRRWLLNLALLAALTLILSMFGSSGEPGGTTPGLVVYVWYITNWLFLPGAVLYLLLLELLPTRWSGWTRRVWAIGLGPLIGLMFWFYVVPSSELPAVTVAYLFAEGAVYGAVVRLREATTSRERVDLPS